MPTIPTTAPTSESGYDIEFFWDPVCPFAWITSRWVVKVAEQSDYDIDWRFISLRLLNKDKDYATQFPPEYELGHTAGRACSASPRPCATTSAASRSARSSPHTARATGTEPRGPR